MIAVPNGDGIATSDELTFLVLVGVALAAVIIAIFVAVVLQERRQERRIPLAPKSKPLTAAEIRAQNERIVRRNAERGRQ